MCSCVKSSEELLNYQRLASSVPSLVYHGGSTQSNNSQYGPEQVAYLAAAAANAFYSINVSSSSWFFNTWDTNYGLSKLDKSTKGIHSLNGKPTAKL